MRRDVEGMIAVLASDVEMNSPTSAVPVVGRERVRPVFHILAELFEDFTYTGVLQGSRGEGLGTVVRGGLHALTFRCRIGDQPLEGMDLLDVDAEDRIARFTVFIRPLAAVQALQDAVVQRMTAAARQQT